MTAKVTLTLIAIIQLVSLGHLYETYKFGSSQIPAAFIELNFVALLNIAILLALFKYFDSEKKTILWFISLIISVVIVVVLLIGYLLMFINKYT